MEELTIGRIKFLQRPAIVQQVTYGFTIRLLIKEHAQNANFSDLHTELETLKQSFEVGSWILKLHSLNVECFNQLLLRQEIL